MGDIKWIKLSVSVFDDEKFDAINVMPDANDIQLVWIKLLCLAGKCNASGFLVIADEIPFTDEMLAKKFSMSIGTVQRAMEILQKLNMISVEENIYMVSNWAKYQSATDLDRIREKGRLRAQKYRDKVKQKRIAESKESGKKDERNVTHHVIRDVICSNSYSSSSFSVDNISDVEHLDNIKNKDKNKDNIYIYNIKEIVEYLNEKTKSSYKYTTSATQKSIKARLTDGFTVDDFKKVIDVKSKQWLNSDMEKYLRPQTLFSPSKFESYLAEANRALPSQKRIETKVATDHEEKHIDLWND